MTEARACTNCGAIPREEARFCESCGAELPAFDRDQEASPKASRAPESTAAEDPLGDLAGRFEALDAHPDTATLLEVVPDTSAYDKQLQFGWFGALATIAVFVVLGLGLAFVFGMMCPPLMVVPIAFAGIAIYAVVNKTKALGAYREGKLQRFPAAVADTRTSFAGGSGDENARTEHHVTLRFPDEVRREFLSFDQVPDKISVGDVGVAYLRGNVLIDFTRVDV